MSADDNDCCPFCKKEAEDKLKNAYGKLSEKKYNELKKEVNQKINNQSVQIYHDTGIDEKTKKFCCSVSAYCSECDRQANIKAEAVFK